jgi:hypothetical protein
MAKDTEFWRWAVTTVIAIYGASVATYREIVQRRGAAPRLKLELAAADSGGLIVTITKFGSSCSLDEGWVLARKVKISFKPMFFDEMSSQLDERQQKSFTLEPVRFADELPAKTIEVRVAIQARTARSTRVTKSAPITFDPTRGQRSLAIGRAFNNIKELDTLDDESSRH